MLSKFGVAIAQLNLTVGDLEGNCRKIVEAAEIAKNQLHCRVVVYPELSITGYPPEDLLFRQSFLHDSEVVFNRIVETVKGIALVVGHPHREDGKLFNAASLIDEGQVVGTYCKHHLPNYGVFDEKRYFASGNSACVRNLDGVPVGITICEDIWDDGPVESAVEHGAQLILNLNGSPFDLNKPVYRETQIVASRSARNRVAIVYANLVGGQDELVFDGGSLVTNSEGQTVLRGPFFSEDVICTRMNCGERVEPETGSIAPAPDRISGIYDAIKLGVGDYIRKNGFNGAVIGVSGGIDSALTLAIVADAIGRENVEAVLMPSRYTQDMSIEDACEEAENLDVAWSVVSIEPIFQSVMGQLAPLFEGYDMDVTEENVQARCRGVILMAISNKKGRIVITTGNKSENAVGYATLYGDMVGGYSAIKDVPKTMVYELARYCNERLGNVIPERVFTRAPTAELAENQRDDGTLPPYEVLDQILHGYIEEELSSEDLIQKGFDRQTVQRVVAMVNQNEYKRRQAAPGVRITPKAFGRDRRYPITSKY